MSLLETTKEEPMSTIADSPLELQQLDLVEVWSKADESQRARFTWAVNADTGSEASALAYVELAPGGAIPRHFDSAGEIDLVLAGVVEVERAEGAMTASAGGPFFRSRPAKNTRSRMPAARPRSLQSSSTGRR